MQRIMVLVAALWCAGMAEAGVYRGYETPDYTIEARAGDIELRRYADHLAAEVTVQGSQRQAVSRGFRVLARYIFGANRAEAKVAMTSPVTQAPSEKIAMTSPVTQSSGAAGSWVVRFMMPSAYDAGTLPVPEDAAIRIVTVSPGLRVATRFSGWMTPGQRAKAEARLRAYAGAAGLRVSGPAEIAYFDDPFTLPWKRRNEVSFPVQ